MLHPKFLAQKFLNHLPSFAFPATILEAVERVLSVVLLLTISVNAIALHRVAPSAATSEHLAPPEPCRPSRMRAH